MSDSQLMMRRPHLENLPTVTMPAGYTLRRASVADAAGLATLLTAAFSAPWDEAKVLQEFFAAADIKATLVAVASDGTLAACASAAYRPAQYHDVGYVHWVGTLPAHAGRSLGYWVSLGVLRVFRELGLVAAVLETDDERTAALKTYAKLGFEPFFYQRSHPQRWAAIKARSQSLS